MLIVRLLLCAVGCECVGLRVYEGRDANPDEFPYLVALGYIREIEIEIPLRLNYEDFDLFCTGTLIAATWVLTAAHCVAEEDPEYVLIRYGNVSAPLEDTNSMTTALKLIPHPSYLRKMDNNDIALVLIQKIFDIKVFARLGAFDHKVLIGKEIQYVGYGLTTKYVSALKNASVQDLLFRNEPLQAGEGYITDCSNLYWLGREFTAKVTFVCVLPKCNNIGSNAGHGDSGGPLFYKQYLVGICHAGSITSLKFSLYNRVDGYIDWIHKVMNQEHTVHNLKTIWSKNSAMVRHLTTRK